MAKKICRWHQARLVRCSFALATTIVLLGTLGCGAGAPPAPPPASKLLAGPSRPAPAPKKTPVEPKKSVELSYSKTLEGVSTIDDALAKVKAALAAQGFGVITQVDVQATMKKKLDVDMRPFWILGACNPASAHRAIEADPEMGLLLPCKVIVYQQADGKFTVAFARPQAMFSLVNRPELTPLAEEVDAKLRGAFDAL